MEADTLANRFGIRVVAGFAGPTPGISRSRKSLHHSVSGKSLRGILPGKQVENGPKVTIQSDTIAPGSLV